MRASRSGMLLGLAWIVVMVGPPAQAVAPEPQAAEAFPPASILFYRSDTGLAVGGTFAAGLFTQVKTYGFSPGWDLIALSRDSILFYDKETGLAAYGAMSGGIYVQNGTRKLAAGFDHGAASCDSVALYDPESGTVASWTLKGGLLGATADLDNIQDLDASLAVASCDTLLLRQQINLDQSYYASGTLVGGRFALKTRFQAPTYIEFATGQDTVLLWGAYAQGRSATALLKGGRYTPMAFASSSSLGWPVKLAGSRDSALIYSLIPGEPAYSYHARLQAGRYIELPGTLPLSGGWTHIVGGK